MTPQEKSEYLVTKYGPGLALIICHEMLENAGFIWGQHYNDIGLNARDTFRKYWAEVISKIQNS